MILQFNPIRFIENLPYLGKGMLGILAVMLLIILAVSVLGRFFGGNGSEK